VTVEADLTCRELVELVTDYLEGVMPAAERARFEEHLVFCPGCVYYLDHMRKTIELAGELTEEQLAPEAEATFLEAFRAWKREAPPGQAT
jgi:anti-sigma factor RsiW